MRRQMVTTMNNNFNSYDDLLEVTKNSYTRSGAAQ